MPMFKIELATVSQYISVSPFIKTIKVECNRFKNINYRICINGEYTEGKLKSGYECILKKVKLYNFLDINVKGFQGAPRPYPF